MESPKKQYDMKPQHTQVPNSILDEILPQLKEVELKVLLVIVRQTLGWIEDDETGRRKEKDWISIGQFKKKTGCGRVAIGRAITKLIEYNLVEANSPEGKVLETARERQLAGSRIFYRLKTRMPTLFDRPAKTYSKSEQVGGVRKIEAPQNVSTTKETVPTKEIILLRTAKTPSAHRQFIDFWYEEVKKARHIEKPIVTGKDCRNLKRIIELGISPTSLEQLAVYFLNHHSFRGFAPNISTFLSAGVLNGLQNLMQNRETFWKELDSFTERRGMKLNAIKGGLDEQLTKLRTSLFAMPISPQERARIDEKISAETRAAR